MRPQSPEWTAPGHRPRHAVAAESIAPSVGGRHHRPETLADATRLRPAPATPSSRRRVAGVVSGVLEAGYPDNLLLAQSRRPAEAMPTARWQPESSRHDSTRHDSTRRESTRHDGTRQESTRHDGSRRDGIRHDGSWRDGSWRDGSWRAGGRRAATRPAGRGKHAAGRADPRPVGGHRAPGTLPLESWRLIGRARQQALLATVVAAGLALVLIPLERHVDVNPISAADRTIIQTRPVHQATDPPARKPAPTGGHPTGDKTPVAPKPTAGATSAPTPSTPAAPPAVGPPGAGPGRSLTVTGSDAIALTFDDGPDPVHTPQILALLDKYQVKATFCLIGTNVEKHPEIVREIVAAGHTLCNHTWNHSLVIGKEPTPAIRADLERTTAAIHDAAPGAPIPFFRAPGGNFTDRLVSEAYGEGMTSLYWQVDPQDWNHLPLESDSAHIDRVIRTVQDTVKPGSIILSHDFNQPDTIEAYERLLPYLTQRYATGIPEQPPADSISTSAEPPAGAEAEPVQPTADSPTGE